ncbi:MAG: sigma-70 family RNA polymerase sigma factor [Phycisphaerae bacterium]|nr:sigma-70 family RNA polymerase sigma factor [Phycisphaerae bacterium]
MTAALSPRQPRTYAVAMTTRDASTPPTIAPAEADLVARLRAGDERAYETLVREQGPRMLAVARRMLRQEDDALDALQDAFVSAFRSIDRFEGNSALMKLRRQQRDPKRSIDDMLPRYIEDGHMDRPVPAWSLTAEQLLSRKESRELVRRSIDELPDDYREVLLLRDIEQLDTAETAEALGIRSGAVKTRLHRARQALRAVLDPHMRQEAI